MAPLLYKTNGSPPARAAMMVADILGLKLNTKDLNPVLREQDTPELTKKNPMRTVPLLEEDDFYLADSHAIMIYFVEKYGRPEHEHLYPSDKRKRATVNMRLFFDCGVLFPRLRSIMAPTYGGRLTEISKSMIRNIEDAYGIIEAYLSETKYLADDVITIADISVIATVSTINGLIAIDGNRSTVIFSAIIVELLDKSSAGLKHLPKNDYQLLDQYTRFPKFKQWFVNMSQQEYCKRINEAGAKEHSDGLKMLMEYNKQKKSKL